eukprot:10562131-Alexandrium_andersonii.AAC.1
MRQHSISWTHEHRSALVKKRIAKRPSEDAQATDELAVVLHADDWSVPVAAAPGDLESCVALIEMEQLKH